jgi:hypothetical protein
MAIYKELLQADPGNAELESRLVALEKDIHKNEENAGDPSFKAVYSAREAVALAEETFIDEPLQIESGGGFCADELLPAGGLTPARNEEHIIHVLEMWLENIRRMR